LEAGGSAIPGADGLRIKCPGLDGVSQDLKVQDGKGAVRDFLSSKLAGICSH